jgi:hypothetical protein
MPTWLRSILDAILGRVPGKTSRLDTATRMMIDADFGLRRESKRPQPTRESERDDARLRKPAGLLEDVVVLEELMSVINVAQERDAEDERRLCSPVPVTKPPLSKSPGASIQGHGSKAISGAADKPEHCRRGRPVLNYMICCVFVAFPSHWGKRR